MSAVEELLRQYQPVVRFDSHEAFFAHDVRAMADNAAFRLTRADPSQPGGYLIATHASGLTVDFLAVTDGKYPGGAGVVPGDHFGLDLQGSDAFADRIGDYRQIERDLDPRWRNVVYGRAVGTGGQIVAGAEDEVWLQYWYFYIYNDAQFGGRVDLHEGDWEMVQIQLRSGVPACAIFAQHAYAEQQPWTAVGQDAALHCPVVYPGRGSHASYFEPGLHRTHVKVGEDFLPLWWDAADGLGPHIRQELVILEDNRLPGWAQWRGRWGGTQPHIPLIDGESPQGPIAHGQWQHPAAFAGAAIGHEKQVAVAAPRVAVRRAPPGLHVRFDFTTLPDPPDRLLLTTTAAGEPPATETIVVDTLARGRISTRGPLDSTKAYTVDVSTISVAGMPTAPRETPIRLAPVGPVSPFRLIAAVLWWWDSLWLWVGSRLARRVRREQVVIDRASAAPPPS